MSRNESTGFTILEVLVSLFFLVLLTGILCWKLTPAATSAVRTALEAEMAEVENVRLMLAQTENHGEISGYARTGEFVLTQATSFSLAEGSWNASGVEAWFARYLSVLTGSGGTFEGSPLFRNLRMAAIRLERTSGVPQSWVGIPFFIDVTDPSRPLTLSYDPARGWVLHES